MPLLFAQLLLDAAAITDFPIAIDLFHRFAGC